MTSSMRITWDSLDGYHIHDKDGHHKIQARCEMPRTTRGVSVSERCALASKYYLQDLGSASTIRRKAVCAQHLAKAIESLVDNSETLVLDLRLWRLDRAR